MIKSPDVTKNFLIILVIVQSIILLLVIFFPLFKSLCAIKWLLPCQLTESDKYLTKDLEMSMNLQGKWLINNQTTEGDLVYERFVGSGQEAEGNNLVRQALSFHSLALLYKKTNDPKIENALEKAIQYFMENTEKRRVVHNNLPLEVASIVTEDQRYNNSSAFVLLLLIEYMEANPDAKTRYYSYAQNLANYLVSTQLPAGGFMYKQDPNVMDDYNNGESLYALVKMYNFDKNPLYGSSVKTSADFLIHYYSPQFNRNFYSWGMQAFFYLYKTDPQSKYWQFMRNYTDLFLETTGKNMEDYFRGMGSIPPPRNTAGYIEGLVHVANLAGHIDKDYYPRLNHLIEDSLKYNLSLQVNGPRSKRFSNNEKIKGGVCIDYYCTTQRIDATAHSLSSIYYYLTLMSN